MADVFEVKNRESRIENRVNSYRDLKVWQKGMDLLVAVYKATDTFPKKELYGLSSQLQRAAVSIPSNLAEGSSRRSTKEFLRFINIATGSLSELETQLIAANRLTYISQNELDTLLNFTDEISRMLQGLYNSLERKTTRFSTLDSNH